MNEQAIWDLATEGGMSALTVERLAEKTDQKSIDLNVLYPNSIYMVITVLENLHRQAMAIPSASTVPLDRLTDCVMSHLDVGLPHREAIQRLWADLVMMPSTLLTLYPYLLKIVRHILKGSGLEVDDFWSPLRLRAYLSLFLYVLYAWIDDESPQQEKTLAILDKGLKQLEALPWSKL